MVNVPGGRLRNAYRPLAFVVVSRVPSRHVHCKTTSALGSRSPVSFPATTPEITPVSLHAWAGRGLNTSTPIPTIPTHHVFLPLDISLAPSIATGADGANYSR